MRFTVLWSKKAENRLAELWLAAADRGSLTAAANGIDRLLRDDPDQQGESRPNGERILLIAPLGVVFRVGAADRIVTVLRIWQFNVQGRP
jgi:hypothetical protein